MLKCFQVITYHPKVYNEFENDIIVTSEYQVMYLQEDKLLFMLIFFFLYFIHHLSYYLVPSMIQGVLF